MKFIHFVYNTFIGPLCMRQMSKKTTIQESSNVKNTWEIQMHFFSYSLQCHCKILLRWQKGMTSFVFDNSFEFYVVPEC